MNLVAVSSKVFDEIDIEIPGAEIVKVDCSQSKTMFEDVARCGIAIEQKLIVNGKTILWTDNPKYLTASIIWDNRDLENFVPALNKWAMPRGDEIIFNYLHLTHIRGWAIGNPRSIIKWAACSLNLEGLTTEFFPGGAKDNSSRYPTSTLVWLADRIGLKVYGYIS